MSALQHLDKAALFAVILKCRAPQPIHWLRHIPLYLSGPMAEAVQASVDVMVTAAIGSNEWKTDPLIERRMRLPTSVGGGG